MTIYEQHGYNNRLDYLTSLAEDAGENAELVFAAAELLGPNEDFDGLISTLEDFGHAGASPQGLERKVVRAP